MSIQWGGASQTRAGRNVTKSSSFVADLTGRTVVLTGATSVLGSAFARRLTTCGARVALLARRADQLEVLAAELDGTIALVADLAEVDTLAAAIEEARARFGPIDTLINAAAAAASGTPAERESLDEIRRALDVNAIAPLVLAQLVHPDMVGLGRGCIVNVGSIAGDVGIGRFPQASYAASKGGLHALTRELAAQWSRYGIRVNTLAPGFFRSEMTASLFDHPKAEEWISRGEMLPEHIEPDDLAGALLFLVSDASAAMTGQTLLIDNGWTAR